MDGLKLVIKNGHEKVLFIAFLWLLGVFPQCSLLVFYQGYRWSAYYQAAYFFYFVAGLAAIPFWLWLKNYWKTQPSCADYCGGGEWLSSIMETIYHFSFFFL